MFIPLMCFDRENFVLQAVVVTKYLFQFGFFPWNNAEIHDSPFWPPAIMGIEQRNNYASADLALLLALFIHRSILKVGPQSFTNAHSTDSQLMFSDLFEEETLPEGKL